MDYSWNKLVDRCQLFVDGDRGLFKELLKDAEQELANQCMIFEYMIEYNSDNMGWSAEAGHAQNFRILPEDYLQDIGVWCNGSLLKKITEVDIYLSSDNRPDTGTPQFYGISGNMLVLDKSVQSGDSILLQYKASIGPMSMSKYMPVYRHLPTTKSSAVTIPTSLGPELLNDTNVGCTFVANIPSSADGMNIAEINGYSGSSTYGQGVPFEPEHSASEPNWLNGSIYTYSGEFSEEAGELMVRFPNWRHFSPIVPAQYHTSLCDYAIAIASAKTTPDMYDKHWLLWKQNVQEVKNRDADRDLIFTMKEVI